MNSVANTVFSSQLNHEESASELRALYLNLFSASEVDKIEFTEAFAKIAVELNTALARKRDVSDTEESITVNVSNSQVEVPLNGYSIVFVSTNFGDEDNDEGINQFATLVSQPFKEHQFYHLKTNYLNNGARSRATALMFIMYEQLSEKNVLSFVLVHGWQKRTDQEIHLSGKFFTNIMRDDGKALSVYEYQWLMNDPIDLEGTVALSDYMSLFPISVKKEVETLCLRRNDAVLPLGMEVAHVPYSTDVVPEEAEDDMDEDPAEEDNDLVVGDMPTTVYY